MHKRKMIFMTGLVFMLLFVLACGISFDAGGENGIIPDDGNVMITGSGS